MSFIQPQMRLTRYLPVDSGNATIKVIDIEKLPASNDAQQYEYHHKNAGKRVFAILVMLATIACLVWSMG